MADPKTPDPSMADILASIRDILNEDEKAEPDEPLDLTEAMLVSPPPAAAPVPVPAPVPPPASMTPEAPASPAAPQARSAVPDRAAAITRAGGTTIEDMVRDEMRPLLQAWIDQHLPGMVESMVKAEIAKMLDRQPD